MLTRALLLVTLAAAAAVGSAPQPAAGAQRTDQAPDRAEGCLPPAPDRARAPTAGVPLLAAAPFRLDASRIELHQIDLVNSNKIVSVRTRQGSKRVLKFIAGAAEIVYLRQTTAADGTASLIVSTPVGSRSRLVGPITLYVEKLCGTLAAGPLGVGFGVPGALLPPISAASPPPLVLPEVTFTGVTVYTAGLSGAQLDVPVLPPFPRVNQPTSPMRCRPYDCSTPIVTFSNIAARGNGGPTHAIVLAGGRRCDAESVVGSSSLR